jgi:hypothetical protein
MIHLVLPYLVFSRGIVNITSPCFNSFNSSDADSFTFSFAPHLVAEFLFATLSPDSIVIDPHNLTLNTSYFLFQVSDPNVVSGIDLKFSAPTNFSVWAINRTLCNSTISVFGSGSNSRFRVNYHAAESVRCFFTIDPDANKSFDYFMMAKPESKHILNVYTNSSIAAGTSWPRPSPYANTQCSEPLFFRVLSVAESSQLAININFTYYAPYLESACLFTESPIYDGMNLTSPHNDNLEHKMDCTLVSSSPMWMYLAYTFIAVGSLVILVIVGYVLFRNWSKETGVISDEKVFVSVNDQMGENPQGESINASPLLFPRSPSFGSRTDEHGMTPRRSVFYERRPMSAGNLSGVPREVRAGSD